MVELYRNLAIAMACVFFTIMALIANFYSCLLVLSCVFFTLVSFGFYHSMFVVGVVCEKSAVAFFIEKKLSGLTLIYFQSFLLTTRLKQKSWHSSTYELPLVQI